ncbi:hypothetical protein [Pseudonocardia spinosispora]|uniref:hypothetical protein n=1 Tax=Pseudonocardia spinosispora TaxID=103441 RepID=UPI00040C6040|nr:hypothetical protein [Pseudonocardia spinosispora]
MRLVAIVVVLAVLVLLGMLLVGRLRRQGEQHRRQVELAASWQDRVVTSKGVTSVKILRVSVVSGQESVLDEVVMAQVPANDPDWAEKVRTARATAVERAFELNVESGTS